MGCAAQDSQRASRAFTPPPYALRASAGDLPPPGGGDLRTPQHTPSRHRRLAVLRIVLHPPAARRIKAAERKLDPAFVSLGRTLDDGPVGLVDGAGLEQLAKLRQRFAMAAEHKATGGVTIEPMRQCRRAR